MSAYICISNRFLLPCTHSRDIHGLVIHTLNRSKVPGKCTSKHLCLKHFLNNAYLFYPEDIPMVICIFIPLVVPRLTNLCYFILLATITVSRSPQIRRPIFHFETEKNWFYHSL